MNRAKIEDTLLATGVPAGILGPQAVGKAGLLAFPHLLGQKD